MHLLQISSKMLHSTYANRILQSLEILNSIMKAIRASSLGLEKITFAPFCEYNQLTKTSTMNEDKHMKFVLKQEMKAVTQYHNILIQNMPLANNIP